MKRSIKKRLFAAGTVLLLAFASIYNYYSPVLAAQPENQETVITSIAPLSDAETEFFFDDKPALTEITASFPQELSVFLNGDDSPITLPITWVCDDDYENTEFGVYDFTPIWNTDAYPPDPSFDSFTDMPHITIYVQQGMASVRLLDAAEAQADLNSLVTNKDVYALLYLCDTYEVKQNPGKTEAAAVNISTGQSVRITGVGEDSSCNIWYQTNIDIGGSSYNGYIERNYLAYADEDLLAWENQWISSQTYRMASPAGILSENSPDGLPADIAQFPASYQSGLLTLKTAHPNWIFVKMNTDLDWNTAVQEENKNSRSLISSTVTSSWKKSAFDKSWAYPTDGILAYYMDPRNFLSENHIFQFELLSYNSTYHSEGAVQEILSGTFMSGAIPGDSKGQSYAQAFCRIAKELDVSPFHLASRVRQEQGEGTSPLISGTHPAYPGVYNYFNIGAVGQGSAQVIENGLKKAAEYKWTTRYLSLEGGSHIISKEYIRKGQNTLYLQKFNVSKTSPSGLYQHQYMQNIAAPSSEAVSVKKAYAKAGSINNPFVFRIPVYKNMPSAACPQPAAAKEISLNKTSLSLKVDDSAALTVSIDGKIMNASEIKASFLTFSSSDPKVASVAADGVITALSAGTTVIDCTMSGGAGASCSVTVTKMDPSYTMPVLDSVTYAPNQTLADIKLPSGWKWDNPTTVPTVSVKEYPAAFTPSDTNKYNIVKKSIPLTVNKGIPAYEIPSGLQASVGNTLSSVPLPAGFSWEEPSAVLKKEGTVSYSASYNPDAANYQTVTGIPVPVAVTPKASTACTSHTYGEWTITAAATCTSAGVQTRSCLSCGSKETRNIPAAGHDYSPKITKEATETEAGVRTYTCSKCQDSYTETIAKLPSSHKHSYSSSISKQPSCTEKGSRTYSCVCGDSYSEEIPATGHDMADNKCRRCGYQAPLPAPDNGQADSNAPENSGNSSSDNNTPAENGSFSSGSNAPTDSGSSSAGNNATTDSGSSSAGGNAPANNGNSSSGGNAPANNGNFSSGSNAPADNKSSAGSGSGRNNTAVAADSASSTDNDTKNVTIDMTRNTVLYEETIASIRGRDINVILNMGNGMSWTITGSNITADEANGIDMAITAETKNIPDTLIEQASALSATGTVIGLSLTHNGPLDFHPVLTISTAPENAGFTANLYYYNPDNEWLEFIEGTEIDANGSICFTFTHASDYVIIISETVMTDTGFIAPDSSAGNEPVPESSEDIPNGDFSKDKTSGINLPAILITAAILLTAIAIGVTSFFLLRSKKETDEEEDEDDEDLWEEEDLSELLGKGRKNAEEDPFWDGDDPDDYREPETRRPIGNRPGLERGEFDDDEFDGFE